jgi:hypothetical protein
MGGLTYVAATPASANDGIREGAPPGDFIDRSLPEWNLDRAVGNDTCWPEDAFRGPNPNPGQNPTPWPDNDSGCARTGSDFPTYVNYKKCNDSEIRVGFTIYQAKSYFSGGGHKHDFEYVVLVWKRNGDTWTRGYLLMSTHGKHRMQTWDKAESWSADRGHAGLGLEYPRIFVGWGSHAMFNNQGGLTDIVSQLGNNEHRSAKYPHWAKTWYEVTDDNDLAKRFDANPEWNGLSTPAKNSRALCGFTNNG